MKDVTDKAIVASAVALARSLDMSVVAEGVEDAEQVELLRQYGCDEIQGFFFSRPLPAQEFIELVARGAFSERPADAAELAGS